MKKGLLFVLIAFASFNSFGMGWGDWMTETPGGHAMNNYSGNPIALYLKDTSITNVKKWYFFKKHIIGELASGSYFIVDERSSKFEAFDKKEKWEKHLVENELTPTFWIRWYKDDWTYLNDGLEIFYIIIFGPLLFLLLTAIWIVLATFELDRGLSIKMKKRYQFLTSATLVTILFLFEKVLEIFPSSI
jgi:hypothetical protein